jgi:hypothetical protein
MDSRGRPENKESPELENRITVFRHRYCQVYDRCPYHENQEPGTGNRSAHNMVRL